MLDRQPGPALRDNCVFGANSIGASDLEFTYLRTIGASIKGASKESKGESNFKLLAVRWPVQMRLNVACSILRIRSDLNAER